MTFNYGSGFLNEDGPAHLPSHSTFDVSIGKHLGENLLVRFVGTNLGNNRYLIDNSNTFGGTHWNEARMLSVQVRYRFRY